MITREIAKYVAAEVAGITYDDVGSSGNIFVGFMPESPAEAVAVMTSGGLGNDTKVGYDSPAIQFIIRGGTQFDRTSGYDLARSIYSALAGLTSTTLPEGTFLVLARAVQSSPADIGADENSYQEWTLNFLLEVRAVTTNRQE